MSTANIKHILEELSQHIVKYIEECDIDTSEMEENDFKEIIIDFLESENSDLPDHENPMDFLNETIDSLLDD